MERTLSTALRLTHSFERVLCVRFSRDANTPEIIRASPSSVVSQHDLSAQGQREDLVNLLAPLQSQDNAVESSGGSVPNMVKNDGLNLMTQTTQILVQVPTKGPKSSRPSVAPATRSVGLVE